MKRTLCIALLCAALFASAAATAQQTSRPICPEPEFYGQTLTLLPQGGVAELDREVIRISTRESVGSILFDIGKTKTELLLDEPEAVVRLKSGDKVQFIVRVPDNNFDPIGVVNIFRFTQTRRERKAETASVSTFGSVRTNKFDRLRFTATRYGHSSYLITLRETPAGEYGILLNNPYCIMESSMIVSTFGIDEK